MSELSLVDFLLARLDEDERHARKLLETDTRPVLSLATTVNYPARILAEVQAKREILEMWDVARYLSDEGEVLGGNGPATHYDVLRFLASVYADHEDYRAEEWTP